MKNVVSEFQRFKQLDFCWYFIRIYKHLYITDIDKYVVFIQHLRLIQQKCGSEKCKPQRRQYMCVISEQLEITSVRRCGIYCQVENRKNRSVPSLCH